jgi:hypothetical protein
MHSMVLLELRRSCTVQHALLTFRPKLRNIVEPKPAAMNDHLHLHTRTWVCNASLLFFSPFLPSLTLFPQSTCKRLHATPLSPHLRHIPPTLEDIPAFVVVLSRLPPSTLYGSNALELLISTFFMSTTYHYFVNSHQEKCFSYFHTRDVPTAARILDKVLEC